MQKEADRKEDLRTFMKYDAELNGQLSEFWKALDKGTVSEFIPQGVLSLAEEIVRKEEKENTMTKDTNKTRVIAECEINRISTYLTSSTVRVMNVTHPNELDILHAYFRIIPDGVSFTTETERSFYVGDRKFQFAVEYNPLKLHTNIAIWPDEFDDQPVARNTKYLELIIVVNNYVHHPDGGGKVIELYDLPYKQQREAVVAIIAMSPELDITF